MKLLHLTYDYPDQINPDKTSAIKKIISIMDDSADNFCISLNRTAKFNRQIDIGTGNVHAISVFGLPKGIFFLFTLCNSIKRIMSLGLDFKMFDRVHAHKLTFEGPIAYYLYRRLKIPYLVTVQQTDFKVLKFKPLLKRFYLKILKDAECVIIVSPWIRKRLCKVFGYENMKPLLQKLYDIPLIIDRELIHSDSENGRFICAFHMRKGYIKLKNIYRVLKAISILRQSGVIIRLDIAGSGPAENKVEHMIKRLGLNGQVRLLGRIDNDRMIKLMSEYRAFVLCSYPETFGMVYIEALSAGIPVIYSKNTGIDGFFDNMGIGIAVQHNNVKEICSALAELDTNPLEYRKRVHELQKSGFLRLFSMESVKLKYKNLMAIMVPQ